MLENLETPRGRRHNPKKEVKREEKIEKSKSFYKWNPTWNDVNNFHVPTTEKNHDIFINPDRTNRKLGGGGEIN